MHSHARTSAKIDATRFLCRRSASSYLSPEIARRSSQKKFNGSFKFKVSDVNATLRCESASAVAVATALYRRVFGRQQT